jgi:CheY-like chemotaxis protein
MRVLAVDSVGAALAALREHAIDVIVSDIGLERSDDGIALIRAVSECASATGPQIPAVAVTAYGRPDHRERVLSAGYQAHVTNPIEPSKLIAAVAAVVTR